MGTPPPSTHVPWLQAIIQKQKECGWVNFFEGLILREWQLAMQLHLRRMRSQKSKRFWSNRE
jgi:hypothetical protein